MKSKGSITVFLTLVLVLLFSFILTALEGARIRGATAYITMLSELSGDSLKAYYYYPLFQEYRLFGVNAGDENGYFSKSKVTERLQQGVEYGSLGMDGGLLEFQNAEVELLEYDTLLSDGSASFMEQVREQALLDGLSFVASELFQEQNAADVAVTGEVYQKQEEALTATATVTEEILRLMELMDGICMGAGGLDTDENGRLQANEVFIKQLLPLSKEELQQKYNNEEVFATIQDKFLRADCLAAEIAALAEEGMVLKAEIAGLDAKITACKTKVAELKKQLSKVGKDAADIRKKLEDEIATAEANQKSASQARDMAIEQLDLILMDAGERYGVLQYNITAVSLLYEEALEVLNQLEGKQIVAKGSVEAYEAFLTEVQGTISEELYRMFANELANMKVYVGLGEQGYNASTMRNSLLQNLKILEECTLSGFSGDNLDGVKSEMKTVADKMAGYTAQGLWFTYGTISAVSDTGQNVEGILEDILAGSILSLVGIEESEMSDRCLNGQDLPSSVLEKKTFSGELEECLGSMAELFQEGGFQELLGALAEDTADRIALELYCSKYFGRYGDEKPYTALAYEREYLLFGEKSDRKNLMNTVLYLLAIRVLCQLAAILKNPQKMTELQNFAMATAGFTGIPALISAIKYALLFLWAVEEAIVETVALLEGKKLAVFDVQGTISFQEIFLFNKDIAAQKAEKLRESTSGATYETYLLCLSFLRKTEEKAYYAMDLIQENIRHRYQDAFRIRNCLTGAEFRTTATLKKLYDTGVFPESSFHITWTEECCY